MINPRLARHRALVDRARACLKDPETPRQRPWQMLGTAFVMTLVVFLLVWVVIFGPGFEYFSPRSTGPELLISVMHSLK